MRESNRPKPMRRARARLAPLLACLTAISGTASAQDIAMSPAVAALYSTVSIYPPSATSMTVGYGFVFRRREILQFTAGELAALAQLLNGAPLPGAGERAAGQKTVVWFD